MKRSLTTLLFLPLFLLSCTSEKREFYYEDNPFQLIRNGDYFEKDFSSLTYEDLDNNISVDNTINNIEYGESFSIIRTSSTCHSCDEFKNNFVTFIKDTFLDISVYSSEESQTSPSINKLSAYFGKDKIEQSPEKSFMSNTPTWYYGSKKEGIKIANWGAVNYVTLKNNFFKYGSMSNIYKFSSISSLKKGLEDEDALIFLLDENDESILSFYENELYPLAVKSSKRTYVLVLSRVKKENKSEVESYFNGFSLMYGNKKYDLKDSSYKAILDEYY